MTETLQNTVPPAAEKTATTRPKPISKGEKLFNWLTYGGIAGLGAFIAGIPIVYWFKYSKKGEGFSKWAQQALTKTGMSAGTAEKFVVTTAFMQGGNVMVPPVKIMENNKESLVRKFNRAQGEPEEGENIQNEAKQSWGSLIKARLLAWTAVFVSFEGAAHLLGKEKFTKFEERFSEHVVCKPLGKPAFNAAGEETTMFRIGSIVALDVFAVTAATVLLFLGSRFFAKGNKKSAQPEDVTDLVPMREAEKIVEEIDEKPQKNYAASLANPPASHAETVSQPAKTLVASL